MKVTIYNSTSIVYSDVKMTGCVKCGGDILDTIEIESKNAK